MTVLTDRYTLNEVIQADQTAHLSIGYDQLLKRTVTIAQLPPARAADPAQAEQFVDAARTLARAELPAVAVLYDQGETADGPFLILEEPFARTLAVAAPLAAPQAISVITALAGLINAAQARQARVPALTADTVRLAADGRVQVMQTGATLSPTDPELTSALARLTVLALSGTGATAGPALSPGLSSVVERARQRRYTSPQALLSDLQARAAAASGATQVVPPAAPAAAPAPAPVAVPTPAHLPAVAPAPEPAPLTPEAAPATPLALDRLRQMPQRGKLLLGGGALVALVLVALLLIRPGSSAPNTGPSPAPTAAVIVTAAPTAARGPQLVVTTRNGSRLNLRQSAGLNAPVVGTLTTGTPVTVIGEAVPADGYTWVHVQAAGSEGWCIKEALRNP